MIWYGTIWCYIASINVLRKNENIKTTTKKDIEKREINQSNIKNNNKKSNTNI